MLMKMNKRAVSNKRAGENLDFSFFHFLEVLSHRRPEIQRKFRNKPKSVSKMVQESKNIQNIKNAKVQVVGILYFDENK